MIENQQQARWAQNEFMGERLPWLLKGRTLGLIGVGTIGSEIARRAEAFGMRVIALRRRPAYGVIGHVERVYGREELDDFLGQCYVLVIAAPLTPETNSMMGAAQFAQLPKGAIVVNVGRAKIIDTDALIASLHVRPSRRRLPRRLPAGTAARRASAVEDAERHPYATHVRLPTGPLG